MDARHFAAHARDVVARFAGQQGLEVREPRVVAHWSNVLVHLAPAPVVARVAATTRLIRPDIEARLAREVALATYLNDRHVEVVPPSTLLPPGPHHSEGLVFSFWEWVDVDTDTAPVAMETGLRLHHLHTALRDYTGELPDFTHLIGEIGDWIGTARAQGILEHDDADMLAGAHRHIADWFAAHTFAQQALHGDAQGPNLLRTRDGRLLWNDFEDACRGPVEWDLTCFARRMPGGPESALEAYQGALSWAALSPFLALRQMQGTVWYAVLAHQGLMALAGARERIAAWRQWDGLRDG
ncbi:MAG: phosphotransferase [Rhodocyclaceae bacterium]